MADYTHPAVFEVVSGNVGPYTVGERFNSEELTAAEAQRFLGNGQLRGLDAQGEPFDHAAPAPTPTVHLDAAHDAASVAPHGSVRLEHAPAQE